MATYPTILVGDLVTADLLTSMLPQTYTKASTTSRINVAPSADDELTGIALAVGTYDIDLVGFHTQTSTTPKLQTLWTFTGTWNNPVRACLGPGNVQTGGPAAIAAATMGGVTASTGSTYSAATGSATPTVFWETSRAVTVTVAGTLSLSWGQATPTAAQTTALTSGTNFTIRRLS
jgi:hypothetical protein